MAVVDKENNIAELKKFFTPEDRPLTSVEFKAEWDQLSDEEKVWFRTQSLK